MGGVYKWAEGDVVQMIEWCKGVGGFVEVGRWVERLGADKGGGCLCLGLVRSWCLGPRASLNFVECDVWARGLGLSMRFKVGINRLLARLMVS